jgi:hypothetical protein
MKYLYVPMTADQYQEFEHSRQITVSGTAFDPVTGRITGRNTVTMYQGAQLADQALRHSQPELTTVYVLHVPRNLIQRDRLRGLGSGAYQYDRTVCVPHCGVERFDLAPDTVNTAQPQHLVFDVAVPQVQI